LEEEARGRAEAPATSAPCNQRRAHGPRGVDHVFGCLQSGQQESQGPSECQVFAGIKRDLTQVAAIKL